MTREELSALAGTDHVLDVVVEVEWGVQAAGPLSARQLEQALSRTLAAVNAEHHFRHTSVPGQDVRITYVVGSSRFGPYAPGEAAAGIRGAVTALHMQLGDG